MATSSRDIITAINRRRLLLAGPAVAVAAAAPAAGAFEAASPEPTPVAVLFQQWKEYNTWLESPATDGMEEEAFDAAVDVRTDLENRMIETPAQDAADVLMMITAYADFGIGEVPGRNQLPKLWEQVRAVLGEGGVA